VQRCERFGRPVCQRAVRSLLAHAKDGLYRFRAGIPGQQQGIIKDPETKELFRTAIEKIEVRSERRHERSEDLLTVVQMECPQSETSRIATLGRKRSCNWAKVEKCRSSGKIEY
jgi:hypothetical protein